MFGAEPYLAKNRTQPIVKLATVCGIGKAILRRASIIIWASISSAIGDTHGREESDDSQEFALPDVTTFGISERPK